MADYEKEISRTIQAMSGRYAPYNIFSDWVETCAIAVQNGCCMVRSKVYQEREKTYLDIIRKYTQEEQSEFARMFVLLGDALTESISDVLGRIYMSSEMGNKHTGQFFTPFHVSEVCTRLGIVTDELPKDGKLSLNEPACGSGGMLIAACKVLHDSGFDFQRRLEIVAQDLDWKGVYMTYLQLSLIGARATVVQGDTLAAPFDPMKTEQSHILRTPAKMGLFL